MLIIIEKEKKIQKSCNSAIFIFFTECLYVSADTFYCLRASVTLSTLLDQFYSRLPLKIRKGVLLSDFLIDQNLWWMNLESSEIQLTPNSFPPRDLSETFLYPAIFQHHQSTETTPNCRVISLKGEV